MNCEQFAAIVDDLDRPGALDEACLTLARSHAGTCDFCEARLVQARSLTAALRSADGTHAGAPERVEAMLRSAFHREKWAVERARSSRRWATAGIAASLLLTGALATWSWRKLAAPIPRTQSSRGAGEKPAVPLTSPAPLTASLQATPPGLPSRSARAGRQNNAGDTQSQDEFAAEFLPYPAGGIPAPFESGEIVRVNLTGSSLAAMGYPVEGDRAGDRFTADVLLGEDGQPRAIRFPR